MKLAWHPFIFDVPPTWEVIRHRNNPDEGQLHLADRHGEQMQVHWKRTKEPPAIQAKRIVQYHGWQVSFGQPTFAGRHEDGMLLTLVFPADHGRAVMESYRPNNGPERHWAAFGLDCVLPAEFQPTDIKALPAMQVMRFEKSRHVSVTIHRYGMLRLIEDEPPTFFARIKRKPLQRAGTFRQAGKYPGEELTYRGGRAWVWRCEELQRLYCLDQTGDTPALVEQVHCQ